MNTPVKFELAKLLKEKGFDEVCQQWYSVEGGLYYQDEFDNNRGFIPVCECEAPTIAEVVMWLYEKHGIWISVEQNTYENKFDYLITQRKIDSWYVKSNDEQVFNSPTKAYEAAIEDTLNNLL
jgi:hypothetical protein